MQKQNILVTGANGFLGRYLVERLLQEGHHVIALTKRPSDYLQSIKGDITSVKCDILDCRLVAKLHDKHKIDSIFHLAGIGSPMACLEDPLITTRINVFGSLNLLELARKTKTKFYFTSSCYAYGNVNIPFKEDTMLQPNSLMGAHKASVEKLCRAYYESYDVSSIILRLFTVYGPGSKMHQFLPIAIKKILTQEKVQFRDSRPVRDYVYIKDAIDAFICAMKCKSEFNIFNVGTGVGTSVKDLVGKLIKISGRHKEEGFKLEFTKTSRVDERKAVSKMVADTEKTKKILGWQAKIKLDDKLKSMFEYYKERLKVHKTWS